MKFKYKSFNKKNIYLIFLIIIMFLYHFYIQSGIEKIFFQTYFPYKYIKKPLEICNNNIIKEIDCINTPPEYLEILTILLCLLYYYNFIPLWLTITLIFIFSIQLFISNSNTVSQVMIGIILGFLYSLIYYSDNLSIVSFLIVFFIGFILCIFVIHKIDKDVYGPIPQWVDHNMIPSIKKKQNCDYYMKILTIYITLNVDQETFMNWNQIEKYLDIIVEKIRMTHIHFDAVVGLKTGGAIISDYVSNKLNLTNYKVKLSKKEYNCNKKSFHSIYDVINRSFSNQKEEYTVCEGIKDNLEGKNIILIDEQVRTGITMENTINYLKNEKKVNIVYPISIGLDENTYNKNIFIDHIVPKQFSVMPWGYDN